MNLNNSTIYFFFVAASIIAMIPVIWIVGFLIYLYFEAFQILNLMICLCSICGIIGVFTLLDLGSIKKVKRSALLLMFGFVANILLFFISPFEIDIYVLLLYSVLYIIHLFVLGFHNLQFR